MGQWKKVITSGSVALLNTVTASGGFSGSNLNPLLAFNGNRTISNNALPTGVYNVNYETTGDISDFIEAVFFKNATPTIVLNQNFTLQQFTTGSIGGTFVGDIEGADEDASQTPQFILGNFDNVLSNSDDNYFSITNSNGVGSIFLNNGITADTTFNIDSEGPQGDAYPLPIIIKDDFGAQSETVVYIQVTPNNAPIIQGSSNGTTFSEITGDTFTANAVLNENNPSGIVENNYFILKFSDSDNDNLSVSTLNLGDATDDNFFNFSINHSAGTIKLNQITSSLDYDAIENRNFSYKITVHDEHHPTQPGVGSDSNAFKEITFNWSVGDNPPPTINDSSFKIAEAAADGALAGTIYPSDTDEDGTSVFLFTGFTLISVQLDGDGTNLMNTGILSDVSPNAFVPSQDPFEVITVGNGIGQIKKKSGAILNSDVANKYVYTATVTDIYNEGFNQSPATITINITDASVPSVSNNGSAHIIESGISNNFIATNTNGVTGTLFTYSTNPITQMNWEVTTVPAGILKVNCGQNTNGDNNSGTGSNVRFRLDGDLSGSATQINNNVTFDGNNTVEVTLVGSQTNFNSTQVTKTFTLNITENHEPTLTAITNTTAEDNNRINYLAVEGAQLDSVLVTADTQEGDAINFDSILLTGDTDKLTTSHNGTNKIFINANTDLTGLAGTTLNYGVKIKDIHGFRFSNLIEASIPIVGRQTPSITAGSSGTIIESDSGTSTNVGITITDNFDTFPGTVFIESFTIKANQDEFDEIFEIVPSTGTTFNSSIHTFKVRTKTSLSGSVHDINHTTFPTKTLNTSITDNFNNTFDGPNITINVTANSAPTIGSFSEGTLSNTNEATSGVILGTHTLSDTDSIPTNMHSTMPSTVSFTGTGLTVANTSNQLQIKAASNLSAGTYNYTATIRDIHGFRTSTVSDSITITQAGTGTFSTQSIFHIVDTAADTNHIHTKTGYTNGNDNGSQGNIDITYNSSEGSPTLASFASSNSQINISSTGLLTIGTTISGSGSPNAGDDITSTITATDNYGNQGTQAITVTVFANDPPSNTSYNTATYSSNAVAPVSVDTILASVVFDDDEHDHPYSASISGTDKDKLYLHPTNAASSSYLLKNNTIINPNTSNPGTSQTLSFNLVVHDKHNLNSSTARTLTIADAPPQVFIYTMIPETWATSYPHASSNIGLDVTDHSIISNGILSHFISSGQIGSSSFSADNGFSGTTVATRIQGGTLTDLKSTSTTTGLRSLGVIANDSGPRRSIIVFPSSSLLANKPYSGSNNATGDTNDGIVNSKLNTSNGQYRFYARETNDNESDQSMFIKYITLDNPSLGYSDWGIIYHNNGDNELTHYWYMVDDNDPKLGV